VKKYIYILIFSIVFLSFATCTSAQNIPRLGLGRYFEVGIEQDGKLVPIENHQVSLQKKPFTIVLYLKQPDGILVNASFTPESFESARSGKPLKEIVGFTDLGMAEDIFNPQAMLIITSRSPHFWYYAHDAEHRFNDVTKKEGMLICKRIIANVLYRDTTRALEQIKSIPEDTLYLVFMRTEWTKDFSQQIEKQREYVKVIFR
jgi:hypothetical protein